MFRALIYRAHCTVIFVIAQLHCPLSLRVSEILPFLQGCRGYGDSYGDSHGYGFGMGMGTVMNPMGLWEFCGDFLMDVRLSKTRQI